MHKLGMDLHEWSREQREEYKTRARGARNNAEGKENKPLSSSDAEDDSLELVNFQEPQVCIAMVLNNSLPYAHASLFSAWKSETSGTWPAIIHL